METHQVAAEEQQQFVVDDMRYQSDGTSFIVLACSDTSQNLEVDTFISPDAIQVLLCKKLSEKKDVKIKGYSDLERI